MDYLRGFRGYIVIAVVGSITMLAFPWLYLFWENVLNK